MTVFEKIIAGELPGTFVHKDDRCVAIMDINPFNPGHILVIPRQPAARLGQLNSATAAHLFGVAHRILQAADAAKSVKTEGFNLFMSDGEVAGQEVPHVHLHIVPRYHGDGIRLFTGQNAAKPTRDELEKLAGEITAFLRQKT